MTVSELEKPSKQSSSLSPQAAAGSQVNPMKEETWNVAMARVSLGLLGGVMILAMHGAIGKIAQGIALAVLRAIQLRFMPSNVLEPIQFAYTGTAILVKLRRYIDKMIYIQKEKKARLLAKVAKTKNNL